MIAAAAPRHLDPAEPAAQRAARSAGMTLAEYRRTGTPRDAEHEAPKRPRRPAPRGALQLRLA